MRSEEHQFKKRALAILKIKLNSLIISNLGETMALAPNGIIHVV